MEVGGHCLAFPSSVMTPGPRGEMSHLSSTPWPRWCSWGASVSKQSPGAATSPEVTADGLGRVSHRAALETLTVELGTLWWLQDTEILPAGYGLTPSSASVLCV